ncbi:DUF2334 domain-containing protein [Thermococcus sp.]
MKSSGKVITIVFLVFLASSSLVRLAYVPAFGHFVILLHDVSPGYMEQLREITNVISAYGFQNETYLLVIPNHGGEKPLCKYPAFVRFLEMLEREGYHIELHGYNHIGEEFNCNASTAEEKLELGLREFKKCGLPFPEYFIAPRYSMSSDALGVLLSHNITVIGKDFIYFPDGRIEPVYNHEYTWYIPDFLVPYQLLSAESAYSHINGTFILSVHPVAVNNDAGMTFLRRFLRFVRKKDWS